MCSHPIFNKVIAAKWCIWRYIHAAENFGSDGRESNQFSSDWYLKKKKVYLLE